MRGAIPLAGRFAERGLFAGGGRRILPPGGGVPEIGPHPDERHYDTNQGRALKLNHYISLYKRYMGGGLPDDLHQFVRTDKDLPIVYKKEAMTYLKEMGCISLLTREGEVDIAKRIEEGEKDALSLLLKCFVAIEYTIELGRKLKEGEIKLKNISVFEADIFYHCFKNLFFIFCNRVFGNIHRIKRGVRIHRSD